MSHTGLIHGLLLDAAARWPQASAVLHGKREQRYVELANDARAVANGLMAHGLERQQRVAVYLPKQLETVASLFGAATAGGVFVPINPVLKPPQIAHILNDCDVRVLITAKSRLRQLSTTLADCPALRLVVLTDAKADEALEPLGDCPVIGWPALIDAPPATPHRVIDRDVAAILYTSGSTGKPKGVVLSHANMVAGAMSVAEYLENTAEDRLLAALPFSFDYGFSQLTTAFSRGASVVLLDYLMPRDVVRAIEQHGVTGLAAVPPLWVQLAGLEWPDAARRTLRYATNSGGAMPKRTLAALRESLPNTSFYLMYGLTEAFRSTYLPPDQVDARPDSIGRAIPNAEVMVLRPDGTPCDRDEPGELVHRGALVSLGYWNDPERTARRFKALPTSNGSPLEEMAVWSGDTVRMDVEGYLYFVGRQDDMIKTSGYRVSPAEVEEEAYGSGAVAEAAAVGVSHPEAGQAIVLICVAKQNAQPEESEAALRSHLQGRLPNFMQPAAVAWVDGLPRNPNGKLDRTQLTSTYAKQFHEDGE
ncbi:MAG: acyl-CoA ligase (AMP-forming), exosortase A system-associated [Pseudomonadota bacterium]